ncbi:hypothetical protein F511_32662 [Dorcoceras hygrometricum]|uniref:Uncharacterized protein n=1 Tax=Dorcoceras hygrometricum TaxID=472368 RepID=A0A2Z7CKK7_9LAMI|nr:hypothetical protein F511_32662 [Dorcoceras hygrometricum]
MVSMKNPLAAILDSNRFTGLNYQDWLRNLNLVLASDKLLYAIEKSPPKEAPTDISPEELVTLKQWWDDEVKARCYVMASMSVRPPGLKPRPAVEPGFPENNATKKQTKPRRDMGSNPSTERNNTTEITARNKMQVLCMRRQGTKGSSAHKGAKELKHSSKNHRQHTVATG